MIRFIGTDAEGLPLKRKQSQRACENCRKRKKRCPHQHTSHQHDTNISAANRTPKIQHQSSSEAVGAQQYRSRESEHHRIRLSPERTSTRTPSQLLSPATACSMTSAAAGGNVIDTDEEYEDRDPRFVGELNPEGIFVAGASPAGVPAATAASSPEEVVGIWVPKKLVNAARSLPGPILPVLLPYLEDELSRALPKSTDYDSLYQIYVEEIHPILPVINLESYQHQQEKSKTLLKLAICLCASSNPKAAINLKKSQKDFAVQVTQLLRSAVDNGLVRDKQIIMQLFMVLALVTQLSDDRHASAEFTCRAISYVHTGGLHLDTSTSRNDNPYITRLFCCMFALDRLNAAIQGRPVLMHERDIGRDLDACIKQQDSLFRLLLQVLLLLDKVIALYRPTANMNEDSVKDSRNFDLTFPAFEDLLGACGTIRVSANLVATVETLYHAVAMLSCRSQSLSELSRNSASHTRQSLSAASIMSIAGNEYRGQLVTLPFVPYAMSLALRVSYRDLRLSKSSFTRTRARRQLLHVCTLLRELGNVFSSSIDMAELAEQTVREMDKAVTTVAGQRRASLAPASHETRQAQSGDQDQVNPQSGTHGDTSTHVETLDGMTAPMVLPDNYDMQAFDPAQFEFDLDIFDHFDPEFDIQAIDAALANSIDPSMPTNMAHWNSFSN